MRILAAAIAAAVLLSACASEPGRAIQDLFSTSKGSSALKAGLKQYEDGDYADSTKSLMSALDQGLNEKEQVEARKHLAFIHCASGRTRPCRDEFRKALAIDPRMELAPAEAGHPVWGPIFRSAKSSASR